MIEIFACIYTLIGIYSYIRFIKWLKTRARYIDWDDIINGFIGFGMLWIIVRPIFHFAYIGDKILDWVNKR